jgi:hypothetical protein
VKRKERAFEGNRLSLSLFSRNEPTQKRAARAGCVRKNVLSERARKRYIFEDAFEACL